MDESTQLKILVVDDDEAIRKVLELRLKQWGYKTVTAKSAKDAEKFVKSVKPDAVITDVVMPETSGLELLRALKTDNPQRAVLLITAYSGVDVAVEAMKEGAIDFLTKPLDYSKLKVVLEEVKRNAEQNLRSAELASQVGKNLGPCGIVGKSESMNAVYDLIRTAAGSDVPVLIIGESGTGKELVARAVHNLSARAKNPFVPVNSAAIPAELMESELFGHEKGAFTGATGTREGCFELAHTGTLFLDEISEMTVGLQPKLLRVLEDGRVRRLGGKREFTFDVRTLAATNREPREAMEEKRLREDLFYRLNVFTIEIPPLRERKTDIPLLVGSFLSLFNDKHGTQVEGIRDEVMTLLSQYSWPGNVRELRNVAERAVILAKDRWIEEWHLPPYLRAPYLREQDPEGEIVLQMPAKVAELEKKLILKTMKMVSGNKTAAAKQLGVDVKTLRNKLKTYG